MRSALSKFVLERGKLFRQLRVDGSVFVCGNEAGDLDSTMTSIAFAYLYDTFEGKPLIPFMNISTKRILDMRGEIKYVFDKHGIRGDDLLTVDDVFNRAIEEDNPVSLILVDHNEVAGRWKRMFSQVRYKVLAVIDHHEDAGMFIDPNPRIIQVCGSTASIVSQLALNNTELSKRLPDVADSLLTTIVFDTVNLTWRQKEIDMESFEALRKVTHPDDNGDVGKNIMNKLEDAIEAVPERDFGIFDLLYKDYKLYSHRDTFYGISTLHTSFNEMLGEEEGKRALWISETERFMAEEELEILLITIAVREKGSDSHYQQFAIFANNPTDVEAIRLAFEEHKAGLKLIWSGNGFSLFDQENITISRKQMHPIMKKFMQTKF